MLYIKIARDGTIIGAEAHEYPVYINHPYYSQIPLRCGIGSAQGVLSLDQSQIYHLLNKSSMPGEHLEAEVITKEEYDYLIEQLDIDDDTEPEPSPDDGDSGSDIMTPQQMRERIIDLEAANEAKDQRIEMLEDCLLEMSEVVYAGD